MKAKKTVRIISLMIIAFIVFQLIPINLAYADGFQSHSQNSKAFLSSNFNHTDVLYIGRSSQKTSIQKVQINNNSICIPQVSIDTISVIKFSLLEIPFDYRKVIRQSIPHYFNGSKYKGNHTAI